MSTPSEAKEKGISRIDSGSTHGWFVRGYRNGKTFSRLFSDQKCGSKVEALAKAREFRDSLHRQLNEVPKQPRMRRLIARDIRNSTGVLGVCRTSKRGPSGAISECFSVSWRPQPGVQKCTSFSIRKYGERKAFQLAVALRRKMVKEVQQAALIRRREEMRGARFIPAPESLPLTAQPPLDLAQVPLPDSAISTLTEVIEVPPSEDAFV